MEPSVIVTCWLKSKHFLTERFFRFLGFAIFKIVVQKSVKVSLEKIEIEFKKVSSRQGKTLRTIFIPEMCQSCEIGSGL